MSSKNSLFLFFWDHIVQMLVCLMLLQSSLKLSSLFYLFIFFSLASVISTTLSFRLLICSSLSSNLVLIPFLHFMYTSALFGSPLYCIIVKFLIMFIQSSPELIEHLFDHYLELLNWTDCSGPLCLVLLLGLYPFPSLKTQSLPLNCA